MTRGPLVPMGPLVTWTMMSLPGRIEAGNVFLRDARASRGVASFAFDDFHAAVEAGRNDVPVMQERIFLEADVDEGGFESVFEIAHFAFENAADETFVGGAFDGEFFELAVFQNGDAGFEGFGVDDDFLVDAS